MDSSETSVSLVGGEALQQQVSEISHVVPASPDMAPQSAEGHLRTNVMTLKVGDIIRDFNAADAFRTYSGECMITDPHIVETVGLHSHEPSANLSSPSGGLAALVRRMKEDGSYDPHGKTLTVMLGAPGYSANNGQGVTVTGHMKKVINFTHEARTRELQVGDIICGFTAADRRSSASDRSSGASGSYTVSTKHIVEEIIERPLAYSRPAEGGGIVATAGGYQATVRKLNDDGTYNPKGDTHITRFDAEGCPGDNPTGYNVVGHLKRTVRFT